MMNMNYKEKRKKQIQKMMGKAYYDCKWLTDKEATIAHKERGILLKSLSNKVKYSFMNNKIYTGDLSPGCIICGEGYWQCMQINIVCTANCFFCPQNRKIKTESPPREPDTNCTIPNPKSYLKYLKRFNFKGVGITGGEPLLVFELVLSYLNEIRKGFADKIYLWLYTNGSLVDETKLEKLKQAGLNEIRFNISANNYDLKPVKLATRYINTVTVEIPAIPEDYEIVKKSLPEMKKIGVKHLNLHNLRASRHNYRNLLKRNYTFLHNHPNTTLESELTALKLVKYSLDKKIGLPINYCSEVYKDRLQGKGYRRWTAPLAKDDVEELTSANYIRRLSIKDTSYNLKKIIGILRKNKCDDTLWSLNHAKDELFIHSSFLKHIDFRKHSLTISYFRPHLLKVLRPGRADKPIKLFGYIFSAEKEFCEKQTLLNPATITTFQELFIENMEEKKALNTFYNKTNLTLRDWKKEVELLFTLRIWEQIESDLPEIF